MRTTEEITAAARVGGELTEKEMRYAICAYDVLLASGKIEKDPVFLAEYFKAATSSPEEFIGHVNSPDNPEFVEWYKVMNKTFSNVKKDSE